MENNIFEIGDTAVVIEDYQRKNKSSLLGMKGKIIFVGDISISLEFPEEIEGGHSGYTSTGTYGRCWNFRIRCLSKVTPMKKQFKLKYV